MSSSKSEKKYFEQGLDYLKSGAKICLSQMRGYDVGSKQGQQEVYRLCQNLKSNVDFFCQRHLRDVYQADLGDLGSRESSGIPGSIGTQLDGEVVKDLVSEMRSVKTRVGKLTGFANTMQDVIDSQFSQLREDLNTRGQSIKEFAMEARNINEKSSIALSKLESALSHMSSVQDQGSGVFKMIQALSAKSEPNSLKSLSGDSLPPRPSRPTKISSMAENLDHRPTEASRESIEDMMSGFKSSIENKIELMSQEQSQILRLFKKLPKVINLIPKKIKETMSEDGRNAEQEPPQSSHPSFEEVVGYLNHESRTYFEDVIDKLKSSLEEKLHSFSYQYAQSMSQLSEMLPRRIQATIAQTQISEIGELITGFENSLEHRLSNFRTDLNESKKELFDLKKSMEESYKLKLKSLFEDWDLKSPKPRRIESPDESWVQNLHHRDHTAAYSGSNSPSSLERINQVSKDITEMNQVLRSHSSNLIFKMELVEELVKDCKQRGVIGGDWTFLAVKDKNSYMVATKGKGLKIVENGAEVWSGKLPVFNVWLTDIIYIESQDSYFIDYNNKLYRKAVNREPPELFIDVESGTRVGACFRYSKNHERLIVNKNFRNISAINLEAKKIEIELWKQIGGNIYDFRLLGDNEDRVIAITQDGYVIYYGLDYGQKSGSIITHSKIEFIKRRRERGQSISVCEKHRYAVVELGIEDKSNISSRVIVLQLLGDRLIQKTSIDHHIEQIREIDAIECFGYVGRHILWLGLSGGLDGVAMLYDYDSKTREFKELTEKVVSHKELKPVKLNKFGKKFYYVGWKGQVRAISVKI